MSLDINLNVNLSQKPDEEFKALINALGELIMSALSDKIAELKTEVDAAVARVRGDITKLNDQITALQAKIDQGLATPEDLAAIDALKASLAALDPTNPAVLPVVDPNAPVVDPNAPTT